MRAFFDHWPYMKRPSYDTDDFTRRAMVTLETILRAAQPHISVQQIQRMVSLLEKIEASVRGYGLVERAVYRRDLPDYTGSDWQGYERVGKVNYFEEAIRILDPSWEAPKKRVLGAHGSLYTDVAGVAWMNGLQYQVPAPPTYPGDGRC